MSDDIFNGNGIEVLLPDDDAFLKIKETLTRIGVASKKDKVLYQSCHIFHKQGRYAIMHFKNLFLFDGKSADFTEDDRGRLNTIANLLQDWGLLKIVDNEKVKSPRAPMSHIKVLPFREKNEWKLVEKYTLGKKD